MTGQEGKSRFNPWSLKVCAPESANAGQGILQVPPVHTGGYGEDGGSTK